MFVAGGGQVTGPRLNASVVPGALDFQLTLSNGVMEIEQLLVFRTSEGQILFLRNAGVGFSERDVRVIVDVEAPNDSPYAWLNAGAYRSGAPYADNGAVSLILYQSEMSELIGSEEE